MLKNGRNGKNDVLPFYWSRTTYSLLGHLYFRYGSPSIKFCCFEFLVIVLTKELFLTSTTPTLPILMEEMAVVLVLDIQLTASSRISSYVG